MTEPMPQDLVEAIAEFRQICKESTSGSRFYDWGSQGYKDSIRHFLASSSEVAQVAVQPGSAQDLAKMIKVLAKHRSVQFAVKSGGHGMAPGFSSTTGILISMTQFSDVMYDQDTTNVAVGAGCLWDQVYSQLVPYKRNVVGGSATQGVGIAGWLLGAGYSLKSSRYGLGIDHVVEFEIVTPDGRVRTVSEKKDKRLFQALRGGGNNFGIVTKFVIETHPQGPTYGTPLLLVPGTRAEEVKNAIVDFVENEKRREAAIVVAFRHRIENGVPDYKISIMCVFDGPKPKRRSAVPFRMFKDLVSKEGEQAWKVDPAGWENGAQVREITTAKTRRKAPRTQNPRPQRVPMPPPKPRKGAGPTRIRVKMPGDSDSDAADSDTSRPASGVERFAYAESASYRGSEDESDADDDDTGFGEMSYGDADRMLGASYAYDVADARAAVASFSAPTARYSFAAAQESDDEGGDAEAAEVDSDDDSLDNDGEMRTMAEKVSQMSFKSARKTQQPVMVTAKVDSMGEVNVRGRFGCLMISKYTKPLLDKMAEEAEKAARYLKTRRGRMVFLDAWPFHAAIFDESPPGAAWPHERGRPCGPMLAYFQWEDARDDAFWLTKLKGTLNRIRVVARALGVTTRKPAYYNNLSLEMVPSRKIYRDNLRWLKKVKREYDPEDVMGRAGGHKIPLPS